MTKIKVLWIVGICALVFCGQPVKSLSDQRPFDEIVFDPSVPEELKASFQKKIDDDHDTLDALLAELDGISDEAFEKVKEGLPERFSGTYLKNPENLQTQRKGWGEVIDELRGIAGHENIIKRTKVRLHYVPYVPGTTLELDVDLKATITTKLSGSPDVDLGGCLEHRRTCTPIECL